MNLHLESLFTPEKRRYGLELQLPYSELLLTGAKTIETRTYPLPANLLYHHILIVESPAGEEGHSALPSVVRNTTGDADEGPKIVGSVVFSECFVYENEQDWIADADKHLVPPGSAYDWAPARSAAGAGAGAGAGARAAPEPRACVTEEERLEALRAQRRQAKQALQREEAAADTVLRAISFAAGVPSPAPSASGLPRSAQTPAARAPESPPPSLSRRRGGAIVEFHGEAGQPVAAAQPGARYGWRVLGVFRAPVAPSVVPQMMRVHRSLYDCGAATVMLPSS